MIVFTLSIREKAFVFPQFIPSTRMSVFFRGDENFWYSLFTHRDGLRYGLPSILSTAGIFFRHI
jgi:hypothetical protein